VKKLIILTILISGITLAGFFGGRMAGVMLTSSTPSRGQSWYYNLGLNPQQAKELRASDEALREESDRICMRICKERLALFDLVRSSEAEPQVIYQKIGEIGAMQVALEREIATHILKVKSILTPERSETYLRRIRDDLNQAVKDGGYEELLES
jgi:uncharacterized membrane protein